LATYVLISGAWHAGWCWERVRPLLEAKGHTTLAPDLLGMGADKTPLAEVSLARWADQIADLINRQAEPVILVGHSRGGIVISETAERVPGRIKTLVYVSALLTRSGESGMDAMAGGTPEGLVNDTTIGPDGVATIGAQDAVKWLYGTTAPEWAERAVSRMTPEPMATVATPLKLSDAGFGSVRRAFIECARDATMPLAAQRLLQQALPCDPVFILDTDHSPFYSDPDGLADHLHVLGGTLPGRIAQTSVASARREPANLPYL
jgi:pimeloyl-ACP methyl ester carboxylesterase